MINEHEGAGNSNELDLVRASIRYSATTFDLDTMILGISEMVNKVHIIN